MHLGLELASGGSLQNHQTRSRRVPLLSGWSVVKPPLSSSVPGGKPGFPGKSQTRGVAKHKVDFNVAAGVQVLDEPAPAECAAGTVDCFDQPA